MTGAPLGNKAPLVCGSQGTAALLAAPNCSLFLHTVRPSLLQATATLSRCPSCSSAMHTSQQGACGWRCPACCSTSGRKGRSTRSAR